MYQSIFSNIGVGIALIGKDMQIISINPQLRKWFPNVDSDDHHACYEIFNTPPRDKFCDQCPVEKAFRDGQVHCAAIEVHTPDGIRYYQITGSPLSGPDGSVIAVIEMMEDITESKKMELALKKNEEKYRRLYNETPVLLHSIDQNGVVVEVNEYWLKTLGYEKDEVLGRKVTEFYTEASRRYAEEIVHPEFFRNGSARDISYQFVNKNGDVLDMLVSATAERDAAGNIIRSQSVIKDITESKRATDALRESEERFRAITLTASDAILLMDDRGEIVHWNPSAERIFGYSSEEALGKNLHLFLAPPRMQNSYTVGFQNFVNTGQGPLVNRTVEMIATRKDGTEFPIEVSTSAINIKGKWHALGIVRDITERRNLEDVLQTSRQQLLTLIEALPDAIFLKDAESRWQIVNTAAQRLFQVQNLPWQGKNERELMIMQPELQTAYQACIESDEMVWRAGRSTRNEEIIPDENGHLHVYDVIKVPLFHTDGSRKGLVIVGRDITELRKAEEERIKTQKLESIGTLAGGIAHDFNNLLQGIFGYISMAKMSIDERAKSLAMLEQAEKALHLSVNLTTQLLTFSKGGKPLKKLLKIDQTIENAVKFALSGSHVSYRLDVAPDLWPVEADAGQLTQVIQNIVINAAEAMAGGGSVSISASNIDIPSNVNNQLSEGGRFIRIVIQDTGIGIPQQNMKNIFDPYFTTKQRGSGLGLATSYSIIRNHNGSIEVTSALEKGTAFTVYLPASEKSDEKTDAPAPMEAGLKSLRVLLMDDDDIVRTVAKQMVDSLGHAITVAENGENAVELYRKAMEAGKPFDLVILDLTVKGGMGGEETVAKLREFDPKVTAVVSSGYADSPVVSDYRAYGFSAILNKPYKIDSLKNCINLFIA